MRTRNADKQELVKQKAIELIVNDGFDGFSVNKLARACSISVATLYIYYRDKDDLIRQIGLEVGQTFFAHTFRDFSPQMPFAEGLTKQWENRARFWLEYPQEVAFYEMIRLSPYGEFVLEESMVAFKEIMSEFLHRAIRNKELTPVTPEVFWSVAYGPLYTLLRFHSAKKGLGGNAFELSDQHLADALKLVIKALTP
ncbi:TetR family transcriptional regulator [Fibrisoma limi BUZ 3]|uniref:TetR family transcriptional regulator n=1 Tax=Fibrisoma limi BUZ 3 TaxID=1185876 RepID=I2GBF1_9BACT|nr:TetR/AcrR family transcriptional regulator [Fibrisoma limi]CCH51225.1 TetR family transcriptional regulator [Fibrisoma limi BUZ 3]